MKKSTLFASIALVIAIASCVLAYTNQVLVVIVTGPIAGVVALVTLLAGWKNKTTRLFSFMSIALALYAILQFYKVNEEVKAPEVEVKEGESETEKLFEEELQEEGFDLEDDEEPIE